MLAYAVSALWMAMRIRSFVGLSVRQLLIPDRESITLLRDRVAKLRSKRAQRKVSLGA